MSRKLARKSLTPISSLDEPTLDEWLQRRGARFLWRMAGTDKAIEGWSIGARSFVVIVYAKDRRGVGGGWDIMTSCDSIDIDATLADAEARLGV